jgi:integrase
VFSPDVDLDKGVVSIERSLEQTKTGLRFKSPKTRAGKRTISLPASAVVLLKDYRKSQLELRVLLGMRKPEADALVFCSHDGKPFVPTQFSMAWLRAIRKLDVPPVKFHALRHSHASALIACGLDIVKVSKRLEARFADNHARRVRPLVR